MTEATTYPTIAAAEVVLVQAGYKRDVQRALWVNEAGATAKVVRDGARFTIAYSNRG